MKKIDEIGQKIADVIFSEPFQNMFAISVFALVVITGATMVIKAIWN